jgi:hypothetical protein
MKGTEHSFDLLRNAWESSMFGFVSAELDAARTFADMAGESYSAKKKMRQVKNARMAYDNAVRFATRMPMSWIERKQITNELNSLRVALLALGEIDIGQEVNLWQNARAIAKTSVENPELPSGYNLARRVRLFEIACSDARATANKMIDQNRSLMAGPRTGRRT